MNPASRSASPWHVYLALCHDNTFYCGICRNPHRRLAQHNGLLGGGARYTRSRRPVKLALIMGCFTKGDALGQEAKIKALPRARKAELFLAGELVNA